MCTFSLLFVSSRRSDKISRYCNRYNSKTSKRFYAEDFHKLCKPYNCTLSNIFLPFCSARNRGKTRESSMEHIFPLGKNQYGLLLCKCGRHENCTSYNTDRLFSSGCSHCITHKQSRSYWNNASVGRLSSTSFKRGLFMAIIQTICVQNCSSECLSQKYLNSRSFDCFKHLDFYLFPFWPHLPQRRSELAVAASIASFMSSFACNCQATFRQV